MANALIKFVDSSTSVSFSPKMNKPSIINSKKLFNLFESFVTNVKFLCYTSPLIVYDDPSIIAFSVSSSEDFFFITFYLSDFNFSLAFWANCSVDLVHFFPLDILHYGPLIQLMGKVKSTAIIARLLC
jgi:hypothetical protein